MSMVGQSRSPGILFCLPKIREPTVKTKRFCLFDENKEVLIHIFIFPLE